MEKIGKRKIKTVFSDKELEAIRQDFVEEKPRGCAVTAHAYLDKLIQDILLARLVRFDGLKRYIRYLPFSRKVALCYSVGMLDSIEKKYLIDVGGIRNKFAHNHDIKDFKADKVMELCNKLECPDNLKFLVGSFKQSNPRYKYETIIAWLMFRLTRTLHRQCKRLSEKIHD